jgi:hypothetical protein
LPGVPIVTLSGWPFMCLMKSSSDFCSDLVGTNSIKGSVETRATWVNCALVSGVLPCAISASVELVPMPMV